MMTSAKLGDRAVANLSSCRKLKKLSLVCSRNFGENFAGLVSTSFPNLEYLNCKDCLLQNDFSFFGKLLPNLKEIDFSGDSWIKCFTIHTLANHPGLEVLRVGHIEHGDIHCQEQEFLENPAQAVFLLKVLNDPSKFVNLRVLYLEQNCFLTSWLLSKLQIARPNLKISLTPGTTQWMTSPNIFDD